MRNLSAVDLNLLVVFEAVFEERNVTRAGERIGLSQPALSKALNRLRHLLDDPLFVRREGSMQPTARALELAPAVRRALAEIATVVGAPARPDFDPARLEAAITIASGDLFDCVLLPPLLARLRREAPGLSVRVRLSDRLAAPAQLAGAEADLAFMPMPEAVTDLRRETLYVEDFVTLAAADNPHVPANAEAVGLAAFLACAHVTISPEGKGGSPTDSWLAARGLARRIALTLPTFATAPLVIATNPDLLTTLPRRFAASLVGGDPRVRLLRPPMELDPLPVHLVWHSRRDADPVHRWVRQVAFEVAARLSAGAPA